MPLQVLSAFTVAKTHGTPNEDRWCHSEDRAVCAVSDGATVSFDSGPWAEILVARFVADQSISPAWLDAAVSDYESNYDYESLNWSQQAAFDRGSFATLLAVWPSPDDSKAYVLGIGDSLAVLLDGSTVIATFPYQQPDDFAQSPSLLSTASTENAIYTEDALTQSVQPYMIAEIFAPRILLMTDALGRWFVERRNEDAVDALMNLRDEAEFARFVEEQRSMGALHRDDTTLVIMGRDDELPAAN